jgi:hypothetical protein
MAKSLRGILFLRLLIAMFLLAGALMLPARDSFACPPTDIEYTYYTDASKTVVCGWKYITCYCSVTSDGCQTPYYDIQWWDC